MLYLSRKIGESIMINGNIEVVVEEVRGKNVKLGFKFPEKVSILRREVYERIQHENQEAIKASKALIDALSE